MPESLTSYERLIMSKRGFTSDEEMLSYLNMDPDSLPDFSSLYNGKALLEGINGAVEAGSRITVYGDYDVDGVMAMTILYKGLSRLSRGNISWFANDRFRDGYSISAGSLEHMLDKCPQTQVILTCDNGIGAVEAWEEAGKRGIKVYVTDHHEQAADRVLPQSIPAVCENSVAQKEIFEKEGRSPEGFCGAELARRLIFELFKMRGMAEENRDFLNSLYAYAGIATIADVMNLNASNHSVARTAMEIIRKDTGFWQVFNSSLTRGKTLQSKIDGDTFGFYYAPAINACSRVMGNVEIPMSVFLCESDDRFELMNMIGRMNDINEMRKEWTEEDKRICDRIIKEKGYDRDPFILIAQESLREGVNGLTAAGLCQKHGVPAIVLGASSTQGMFKGSARSVDSVNIFEKLVQCSDLLVNFGGHPKAAGISIMEENIEEFRRRMKDCVAADLVREEICTEGSDFTLEPTRFSESNIRALSRAIDILQPFGEGFKKPVMYLEADANASDVRYMSDGVHAKLKLTVSSADGHDIWVMMWRRGSMLREMLEGHRDGVLHIRGMMQPPEINDHNGWVSFQMIPEKIEINVV